MPDARCAGYAATVLALSLLAVLAWKKRFFARRGVELELAKEAA